MALKSLLFPLCAALALALSASVDAKEIRNSKNGFSQGFGNTPPGHVTKHGPRGGMPRPDERHREWGNNGNGPQWNWPGGRDDRWNNDPWNDGRDRRWGDNRDHRWGDDGDRWGQYPHGPGPAYPPYPYPDRRWDDRRWDDRRHGDNRWDRDWRREERREERWEDRSEDRWGGYPGYFPDFGGGYYPGYQDPYYPGYFGVGDRVPNSYIVIGNPGQYGLDPYGVYYMIGSGVYQIDRNRQTIVGIVGNADRFRR